MGSRRRVTTLIDGARAHERGNDDAARCTLDLDSASKRSFVCFFSYGGNFWLLLIARWRERGGARRRQSAKKRSSERHDKRKETMTRAQFDVVIIRRSVQLAWSSRRVRVYDTHENAEKTRIQQRAREYK